MAAQVESNELPCPPVKMLARSRSHGIEVFTGPDSRQDGAILARGAALDVAGRALAVPSDDGKWLAVSGGPKAMQILSTTSDAQVTLADDTAECERVAFSPRSTYCVTWQRANPEKFPDGSLRVWSVATGSLLRVFHCKILNKGGIPATLSWSGDDAVAMHCVTNTVHVHTGDFSKVAGGETDQIGAIGCPGVALFAASPARAPPYAAALFVKEAKGRPAKVEIYQFPPKAGTDGLVCAKAFYRAQDVTLKWSPTGVGVLVQTHTDVDATNSSYYGSTGLYLLHATQKNGEPFECLVPLPKEGPIGDAAWAPNGREFVVIAGAMPAAASLYNADATPIFAFGAGHRNICAWSPHGRFLAICGFGNLAGDVDFWDRHKKKKLGTRNLPCAVEYGWSPDSRQFMVATCAPRMNVDNGIKVYRYDGSGPVSQLDDRSPLYAAGFLPANAEDYPDRGASPGRKSKTTVAACESKPAGAYVPPAARGRGSALADMIRADRTADLGKAGKVTASAAASAKGIPGAAVEKEKDSRDKKRKEAAKKRKDAEAAAAALESTKVAAPAPPAEAADEDMAEADLQKKKKAALKKKKQVDELKVKVAAGLKPSAEQKEKIDRAGALDEEIAKIDELLAKL
ncbi:eukaryotic translation initiation factor eIF2A-domain-containing protein [Pelagophyceae sp. CCMP2097]|nr:eukaryotic translation initiation factor eIF2A-domain-containing protein [Pelagophyceae sp. CCMP2097]|mmetsp:Transcript_20006/g.67760  ORF Transcript_20006/g.67760 Transcript_20006/m.67760 type:complete len:628 (-) Transcript_20006:136-2019(-)